MSAVAPAADSSTNAATPRESRKKGRMPGSKNFTDHEIFTYIKFIHERLPTVFGEWDLVYKEYNKWAESDGFTKRPQESLKKQWNQRVSLVKTADDLRCPWDVQLVKKVLAEIEAGHQLYNIDESEHSTIDGNNSNRSNGEGSSAAAHHHHHHHHLLPPGPFTPFSPSGSSMEQEGFNPAPRSPINSPVIPQEPQRRTQQPGLQPAPAPVGPSPSSTAFRRPSRPQQPQDPELGRFLDFSIPSRQSEHEARPPVHHFLERESYEKGLQIIRLEDKLERIQTRHQDEVARLQEKVERLDRRNRKLEQENQVLRIKNMLLRGEEGGESGKRKRSRVAVDIESDKEEAEEETDDEGAAYTEAPEAAHGDL